MGFLSIGRRTSINIIMSCTAITLALCFPGSSVVQGSSCDAGMSNRLATAYALASFYPDGFVSYLGEERTALSSPAFQRCIRGVANALLAGALNQPSSQEMYERSMDIAARAGAPELGPKVADSMMQTQGNYALVGIALNQLSEVLAGNIAYENTLLYQSAMQQQWLTQIWGMAGGEAELPGFWKHYMQILFEATRDYMEFVASSIQ